MPLLEIEQKFSFTLASIGRLITRTGHPPFKHLTNPTVQTFRDTYFDSHNKLSDAGLWIRKRHVHSDPTTPNKLPRGTPQWEAKQRKHGGSFLRSTFIETKDPSQIRDLVRAHLPALKTVSGDGFGLDKMAEFETRRLTFLADDTFTVVLDFTGFGHEVGEIELMAEDAGKAHADIDGFVKEYAWFFDMRSPKGKLRAYFDKFGYPK
ncbi:CYTH-like domain-containing protein [Usnea florida]